MDTNGDRNGDFSLMAMTNVEAGSYEVSKVSTPSHKHNIFNKYPDACSFFQVDKSNKAQPC